MATASKMTQATRARMLVGMLVMLLAMVLYAPAECLAQERPDLEALPEAGLVGADAASDAGEATDAAMTREEGAGVSTGDEGAADDALGQEGATPAPDGGGIAEDQSPASDGAGDAKGVESPSYGDEQAGQDARDGQKEDSGGDSEAPATDERDAAGESADKGSTAAVRLAAEASPDEAAQSDERHPARPANAVDVAEGSYVIETYVANDKVLDAAGKKPKAGSNVSSWSYNGGDNQVWRIVKDIESAWYRILCGTKGSELALGLSPNSQAKYNVGLVDAKAAGDAALWCFVRSGSWYRLVNCAAEGLCLEVANKSTAKGANIRLGRTNAADRAGQVFFLIKTKPSVKGSSGAGEGAYALTPTVNDKLVCEVRRASTANKANVSLYRDKGDNHQKLYVESAGKGFYTLWVVGSRKVLAQASSSIMPGTNVVQMSRNASSAAQLWSITKNADGTLTFVNKASGLALAVSSAASGANVFGTRNDGYKTTRFRLSSRELLGAGIVEIHPRTSSRVSLDVCRAASSGKADLLLYTDGDKLNQRFELVSVKGANLWRVRTASSGGWIYGTKTGVYQDGRGSSSTTSANTWRVTFKGGGYSLVNCATGLAMDMRYGKTASGTKIIAYKPNGRDSQHYAFDYTTLIPSGVYFLRNGKGGYLSIEGDRAAAGARAQTRSKDGGVGQYFTVERSGTSLRIKNSYSGRYLAVKGGKVVQDGRGASSAQRWVARIEDGGRFAFADSAGRCLDASSGSQLKTASASHAAAQKWQATKTSYRPYSGYTQRAVERANDSYSDTGYLVVVDKSAHRVVVMTGENGSWRPSRDMPCSVGAWETPTVEGSFVVQDRGTSFGEGYTCWYWTQFYNDYLFHSVVYDPGSMSSVQDGRLGMHISHGCVRMDIDDAYWIYATIPSGTRVLIYS